MSPSATLALDGPALAGALVARDPRAAADPARVRVVRAPGRVNLIGEHTDYNGGFVLPIAIDRGIAIALVPTDDRRVEVTLADTGETDGFDLDRIGGRTGSWIDYVAGTAWALREAGEPVDGFRGLLASNLPQGAGLASSAALELASALALSGGAEPAMDWMTLARIAQHAENDFVGVQCGLMDQFASAFGRSGAALLLDCRSLDHRAVRMDLSEVALVVCHSGSPRRLEASAYNRRRAECAAAVAAIAARERGAEIRDPRDVSADMLAAAAADGMDPILVRRLRHVTDENERVLETVGALEAGDLERVGRLFGESHASLRDLYEVSSPELDALVEIATGVPGVLGSRLTGAGFGGCTITLVRRNAVRALTAAIEGDYPGRTGLTPTIFEVRPSGGAGVVDLHG
jgi:galactokinase